MKLNEPDDKNEKVRIPMTFLLRIMTIMALG